MKNLPGLNRILSLGDEFWEFFRNNLDPQRTTLVPENLQSDFFSMMRTDDFSMMRTDEVYRVRANGVRGLVHMIGSVAICFESVVICINPNASAGEYTPDSEVFNMVHQGTSGDPCAIVSHPPDNFVCLYGGDIQVFDAFVQVYTSRMYQLNVGKIPPSAPNTTHVVYISLSDRTYEIYMSKSEYREFSHGIKTKHRLGRYFFQYSFNDIINTLESSKIK